MKARRFFSSIISSLTVIVFIFCFVIQAHASSPSLISSKITGPNTVTLTFSEQVNTSTNDYINFTGSLSGRNLITVNGSGSTIVTLLFDGSPFAANATGGLTIKSTLVGTYDNAPLPVTNSANASQNSIVIGDGQAPTLSAIQISSNNQSIGLGTNGNTGTITFSTNEPIMAPSIIVGGSSIPVTGNGAGPYTGTFTINQNLGASISFSVTLSDMNSNTTQLTLTTQYSTTINNPISTDINLQETQHIGTVSTPTPTYMFSSNVTGKITYYGDCSSSITTAVVGVNSIPFNALSAGTHSNCYLSVSSGNTTSNLLAVSPFTVNITGATQTSNSSGTSVPGCAAGAVYSTTTGAKCPQPTTTPSQSSSTPTFVSLLKYGSSGSEVLALQNKLKALGFLTATPNGYFGLATEAAVKKFQSAHKLSPIGQVGPSTRAVLNSL